MILPQYYTCKAMLFQFKLTPNFRQSNMKLECTLPQNNIHNQVYCLQSNVQLKVFVSKLFEFHKLAFVMR
jgi:hypothetical protein